MSLAPVPVLGPAPIASAQLVSPLPSVLEPSIGEANAPLGPRKVDALPPASRARPIGAWSAIGVGGAALVSVGALWWTGRARLAGIGDHCNELADGCAESDAQAQLNDAELPRLERGINASIAVSATAFATFAVLWSFELFGPHKKSTRARAQARGLSLAF